MTRTDTASRAISAPPERVFAGLIDPEAPVNWLPPDGMRGRFEQFDVRPRGSYRLVLTCVDATGAPGKAIADSDIVDVQFDDIVPDVRVIQAVEFVSDDPAYRGTMRMTWEVSGNDAGFRVEIPAGSAPGITRLGLPPRWKTSPAFWRVDFYANAAGDVLNAFV